MIVTLVGNATGSRAGSINLRPASRCSTTDVHWLRCRAIAKTSSSVSNHVREQPSISTPVRVLCSRLAPVEASEPEGRACSGSSLRDDECVDADSSTVPRADKSPCCIVPCRAGYTPQAYMNLPGIGRRYFMQRLLQNHRISSIQLPVKKSSAWQESSELIRHLEHLTAPVRTDGHCCCISRRNCMHQIVMNIVLRYSSLRHKDVMGSTSRPTLGRVVRWRDTHLQRASESKRSVGDRFPCPTSAEDVTCLRATAEGLVQATRLR